ncbi:hypothetical protein EDD29_5870 [Actinocorallia herbida]|uniref:Uncharacterized protein n=1 Tax=Actinocorallia herbida TaxID=58109 RepID=A0A3N1D554_9ACTN|nr:hypothetical protein [Actinocorallia herbida]ROO88208.1 hypothetical protein EDD29_5870 [Actinocorallia herbida]
MRKIRRPPGCAALVIVTLVIAVIALGSAAFLYRDGGPLAEGEVEIGAAAPPGQALALPSFDKDEVLPAREWPSACRLVTQDDVLAILPEAEEIASGTVSVTGVSPAEFAADPGSSDDATAFDGRCIYAMRLPGETYQSTRLWVEIQAIAHPDLIERYYTRFAPSVGTEQGAHGADACGLSALFDTVWVCRKGPVMFRVGGHTTVAFEGRYAPADFAWRDDISPLVVQTVSARIP